MYFFDYKGTTIYFVFMILVAAVLFFFKIHQRKEKQRKINNFFKTFYQLNDLLKTATQTLYDILSIVEIEVNMGISERVNLLEKHIKTLSNCINQLSTIKDNCVEPELRKACLNSIIVLEHAVKKVKIQLFNMSFLAHDFRDYFLKVTENRLKLINLEKEIPKTQ
jgi:hypothetical protein